MSGPGVARETSKFGGITEGVVPVLFLAKDGKEKPPPSSGRLGIFERGKGVCLALSLIASEADQPA